MEDSVTPLFAFAAAVRGHAKLGEARVKGGSMLPNIMEHKKWNKTPASQAAGCSLSGDH
jgi:hypothetical protein